MKRKASYLKVVSAITAVAVLMLSVFCIFSAAVENTSTDLNIAYCNLSFENDTHIMYAIKSNNENVTLLVWSEPQAEYTLGTQKTLVSPLSEQMTINGELYTVFKYTGVAANQMTDDVYVRVCIDNGAGNVTYGNVHKYSILQYAYNKLGKTDTATTNEKLINMLNNMLAYGASAQEYHNYKTDRLATDTFVQIKLTEGTLPDGFKQGLYLVGESVTLSAPAQNAEGTAFTQWRDKNGAVVGNTATYALTVGSVNNTYTPEYIKYSARLEFESNDDETCYLIGIGDCTDTDIKIPAKSPDGDTVIGIDRNAFSGEAAITSVSIPASIEEIGRNAFNGCTALTDVYYDGTEADWALIDIASGNDALEDATKHFAVVEETYTNPTIVVSTANATAGDSEVEVTVSLKNNPGITSMLINIGFDDTALELVSMTYNSAIGGTGIPNATNTSPITAYWAEGFIDVTGDWVFVTLRFNVSSSAASGDYDISLTYSPNNIFDATETNVAFDVVPGKITIS